MRPEDECLCQTSEKDERLFTRDEILSVNLDIGRRILEVFGNHAISNIVFRLRSTAGEINSVLKGESLPSCELLLGIHRLTGVSIDWLLTGEGERFPIRIEPPTAIIPASTVRYVPGIQPAAQHLRRV